MLGFQLSADSIPVDMWVQATAVLLMALVGGFLPISVVMGISRWRLGFGYASPIPVGVNDFLALIAFVAVVFAYLRQTELFGGAGSDFGIVLLGISFYALIGAAVTSSLLIAMRLVLQIDGPRSFPMKLVEIAFTLLLVTTAWTLIWVSDSGSFSRGFNGVVELLVLCGVSWGVASGSAVAIAWWLRRCGCRLATATTEKPTSADECPEGGEDFVSQTDD